MKKYTLVGVDGNAFGVLGYVVAAMRRERCTREEIDEYKKEATAKGYEELIVVSMRQIDKLNERYATA